LVAASDPKGECQRRVLVGKSKKKGKSPGILGFVQEGERSKPRWKRESLKRQDTGPREGKIGKFRKMV